MGSVHHWHSTLTSTTTYNCTTTVFCVCLTGLICWSLGCLPKNVSQKRDRRSRLLQDDWAVVFRHITGHFGDVPQADLSAWNRKTKPNTTKEHIHQWKEMYNTKQVRQQVCKTKITPYGLTWWAPRILTAYWASPQNLFLGVICRHFFPGVICIFWPFRWPARGLCLVKHL